MKTSIYKNDNFYVSVRGESLFLDVVVEVKLKGPEEERVKIISWQLNSGHSFLSHVLANSKPNDPTADFLQEIYNQLKEDLTNGYFTYFYSGDIKGSDETSDSECEPGLPN